jgi:hypothetical protein
MLNRNLQVWQRILRTRITIIILIIRITIIRIAIILIAISHILADASALHNVGHNSRIIEQQTLERKYKRDYFESQIRFIKGLTDISVVIRDMNFKTKELKNEALRYSYSISNSI